MDLKSILARVRPRIPSLDRMRRWLIERRRGRALRLHTLQQSLGEVGFTPHIEVVVIWRRRFYAVLAAFVLLLVGCLLGGTAGDL